MSEKKQDFTEQIESILMQVDKPARYIGGEINMVVKNIKEVEIRFAFCFPDAYEIGMSHLGLQILYYYLNEISDVYCERAFAPWADMESRLRERGLPLFSLETWSPIAAFDIVGFTLQYEMTYTNVINMLDLAGIPRFSNKRTESDPIICAGGPCAYNPEPLAEFIDFFYIGEGEAGLGAILDIYRQNKASGGSRADFLSKVSVAEGVYVPGLYYVDFSASSKPIPLSADTPEVISKIISRDVDKAYFPEKQLVPLTEIVHDRVALEVFRGCMRGCRFCQAGYVYRPLREKRSATLISQAESLLASSGHDEISLVSLSTGDYSEFKELANGLMDRFSGSKVNISLPSLRIDALTLDIMNKAQSVRKSSLTFAPEAGTQRLRDVINKGITEDEILNGCELAFKCGWNRVKLYFMVGLPTETDEDLLGIARLAGKILDKYYECGNRKRPPEIVVSTSCFSPKPFTPFQWERQCSYEELTKKHALIKKEIKNKHIKYNFSDGRVSVLEGVVSRGDRRVGAAILRAWELGTRFDGWTECFDMGIWERAFEETGIETGFYSGRQRDPGEVLPWDHIDAGITKRFLQAEREKAYQTKITANCRESCAGCGAARFSGGLCDDV